MAWGAELLAIGGVARQPAENPFGGVRERRRDAVAAEASRERQRRPQAMMGIMGFCSEACVPGSVPFLAVHKSNRRVWSSTACRTRLTG